MAWLQNLGLKGGKVWVSQMEPGDTQFPGFPLPPWWCWDRPRAWSLLGKHPATELHPQPWAPDLAVGDSCPL